MSNDDELVDEELEDELDLESLTATERASLKAHIQHLRDSDKIVREQKNFADALSDMDDEQLRIYISYLHRGEKPSVDLINRAVKRVEHIRQERMSKR